MIQFQVGQNVRCVAPDGLRLAGGLVHNAVYKIIRLNHYATRVVVDTHPHKEWDYWRFEFAGA